MDYLGIYVIPGIFSARELPITGIPGSSFTVLYVP